MKVSSEIEEIEGKKYIVERREDGSIICKSPYDEPTVLSGPEIDTTTITEAKFKELVLKKMGYKVKSIGEVAAL